MRESRTIRVFGQVQGVFYRWSAKEMAEELGITGWVKNEADGTVSLVIEGEKQALDAFIDWCRSGSRTAKVERISVENSELKNYQDFQVI